MTNEIIVSPVKKMTEFLCDSIYKNLLKFAFIVSERKKYPDF